MHVATPATALLSKPCSSISVSLGLLFNTFWLSRNHHEVYECCHHGVQLWLRKHVGGGSSEASGETLSRPHQTDFEKN